jgi:hypothetical protein
MAAVQDRLGWLTHKSRRKASLILGLMLFAAVGVLSSARANESEDYFGGNRTLIRDKVAG